MNQIVNLKNELIYTLPLAYDLELSEVTYITFKPYPEFVKYK